MSTPAAVEEGLGAAKAANFDRLAGVYRWMEWISFGPWLWWCRCAFLNALGDRRRALILGDGDGRFTARLLATHGAMEVDAVDSSPAMLKALARNAGPNALRLRSEVADVRAWTPRASDYDLVVTHFFLDCLTTDEAAALARSVGMHMKRDGVWVVSEFDIPESGLGGMLARPLIAFLYLAFGWLTGLEVRRLPDYRRALGEGGFALRSQQKFLGGLLVSEMWQRQS